MKKPLLLLIILVGAIAATKAFALENQLIFSEGSVKKITTSDESIATVKPFFTIMNEKDTFILEPKKEGNVDVIITLDNCVEKMSVKITKDKTIIKGGVGFSFLPLDLPPNFTDGLQPNTLSEPIQDPINLDKPPVIRQGGGR